MKIIDNIEALEDLYAKPLSSPLKKVQSVLTSSYQLWIEKSRFVVLTTVGPEGTDASPRGDKGSVVTVENDQTLLLPD